jgi:RNA polymerase-binding transcription factor
MDIRAVRQALERRRQDLVDEVGTLTEVPRDPMAAVSFGKRIGEGTNEAVDRLTKVGAAKELSAMLADVERALAKVDEGTYGVCDVCGTLIDEERLDARPWTARCVRCASLR